MRTRNKVILITGGSGSLGKQLLGDIQDADEIRVLSRSEAAQIPLKAQYPEVKFILGDVRDKYVVQEAMRGCDIVIHAAAFKFLDLAEQQAREAVLTNVVGSLNVIEAAEEEKVKLCVGISTDKVAYARNVYGCTKHIMEKLFREANRRSKTKFACVRYGNVVGTTGSVFGVWGRQAALGQPLTLTDKKMRRFFFSVEEAVELILHAIQHAKGGEVFAIKMGSESLYQIAKSYSKDIKITGLRPGEKIYETLIADYEGEEFTSKQSGDGEIVVIR